MKKFSFEHADLVNLQYSSRKEIFINNKVGAYSYTTICNYNTRKYHGEFVVPIPDFNNELYVLLSSLDISVIRGKKEFNLGVHKYNNGYYAPHGHKYLKKVSINDGFPVMNYCMGDTCLTVSKVLKYNSNQLFIAIKLDCSEENVNLRLRPLLAFRNVNQLTESNFIAKTQTQKVKNGIKTKLYEGFPELFLQTSTNTEFVSAPLWYHGIEYYLEELRGYEHKEDLFVPGYMEVLLKQGETIILSVSLEESNPKKFVKEYKDIIAKKNKIRTSKQALKHSAKQFFRKNMNGKWEMVSGYPWYDIVPRDIFITNPILMLESKHQKNYLNMISYYLKNLEVDTGKIWQRKQVSADAPLWLFWSLYEYSKVDKGINIWRKFGQYLQEILEAYKNNSLDNIEYRSNGLLYITEQHLPLTWMNSVVEGKTVVNRYGFVVEICGLWYNAVSIALSFAEEAGDENFIKEWSAVRGKIEDSFQETFKHPEYNYLADYVTDTSVNFDMRPNQLIAVALPYVSVGREVISAVLQVTEEELLTPKGIRTLSPKNKAYKENYYGNHYEREQQAHQGMVYPWLLPFYCKVQDLVYKHSSLSVCKEIYASLEEELEKHGIGTLGEMFTSDPPYRPIGAFSMAKSVSAMLSIKNLIKELKRENKKNKHKKNL